MAARQARVTKQARREQEAADRRRNDEIEAEAIRLAAAIRAQELVAAGQSETTDH